MCGDIEPDTGVVLWDGDVVSGSRAARARRGLFFLPDHDLLSPAFTVRRQFTWFERQFNTGVTPESAAAELGIEQHLEKTPLALSGGELRRAEVACAFVRRPDIFVADEPYRGISPLDAEQLSVAFRKLASSGVAVIITGHEVPTLMAVTDHVTWCTSGTTYELGAPEAALLHERFGAEYLVGARGA